MDICYRAKINIDINTRSERTIDIKANLLFTLKSLPIALEWVGVLVYHYCSKMESSSI